MTLLLESFGEQLGNPGKPGELCCANPSEQREWLLKQLYMNHGFSRQIFQNSGGRFAKFHGSQSPRIIVRIPQPVLIIPRMAFFCSGRGHGLVV